MLNYTYHVGQYLPDWHPWEDYKSFFVNDKRSNGCRELFAIELPWLADVFGEIVEVDVLKSKMSSLSLDYNDNYIVLIQHATGYKGTLSVDVVSRKAVRNLEVFGEQLYLTWDGSPKGLYVYDYDKKQNRSVQLYQEIDQLDNYSSFVVENAYTNEIISFFKAVTAGKLPVYNFEKDKVILNIIDEIEA
jgi:predicted dehydrogenase